MLTSLLSSTASKTFGQRAFSASAAANRKVAVLGAAGGIGQPLSLLVKQHPLVTSLSLYDVRGSPGVAADISHINTPAKTEGFLPDNDGLKKALEGAEVVLIPAGVPRKPGMTRDDLFNTNASIVKMLAEASAKYCPKAMMLIIANPVNSTVPIVAETFKRAGVYDPQRLFGVTTLDVVRASAFVSGISGANPADVNVQVIGGHSGATIVPLLSQIPQGQKIVASGGQGYADLVHRIQFGGDEVVKAKDGAGSATLSMAYAAAVFNDALLQAMDGKKGIVQPAYVESPHFADKGAKYFASNVELGPSGVQKVLDIGKIAPEEEKLLEECLPQLAKNIQAGEKFVADN